VKTPWIGKDKLEESLERNEAFWNGNLENGPLVWITVPEAKPGTPPPEPEDEEKIWTDVDYYVKAAEDRLARTYYAGSALPVCHPWLGPDQVSAWLGAEMTILPKDFTSWIKPFVDDWSNYPKLTIDPDNSWWKLYLELLTSCAEAGKDKWITAYPDLHTGIDGLGAIRGPENLMMDMLSEPETIHRAMGQMIDLWKSIVDTVSGIILPYGQGTSNWTMGYSSKRFLCIGQNDFSCLISPEMFEEFCWQDNVVCSSYVDHTIYHLDGPDALRHLPKLLEIENLDCIQWVQGAGNPLPSQWTDMLNRIQEAGKSVQVLYVPNHGGDADLREELDVLCQKLDRNRLFFWAVLDSVEQAEALVGQAKG
jgi:succinate dehydrogenase flavin-adding protein (antitoxin of CptAB toxin-antitoxin module)